MTTTQLVSYVQAHSFPAWADDDASIHVVVPWVIRDENGALHTGHDVQTVPANLIDVQSLISR
jgi:hypothetical protein